MNQVVNETVVVPREPTEAMMDAMAKECGGCTFGYYDRETNTYETDREKAREIYRAMLAAAPSPAEGAKWGRPLDKPARVGATVFRIGVGADLVVQRAQREYEYHLNPPSYDKAVLQAALAKTQCTCEQTPGAGCSNCPPATPSPSPPGMAPELFAKLEAGMREFPSALRVAQEAVLDEETLLDAAHILLSCGGPGWDHVQEEAAHRIGQRMIEAAERTLAPAAISSQGDELERLRTLVNSPELHDFSRGVVLEAGHQRERWGNDHDAGKEPADWFWLVGYLAGKALNAHKDGNTDKALHHTISTAAALANWHGAILGTTNMRPGIDGEAALAAAMGGQK